MLAAQLEGHRVTTIEGLALDEDTLHPIQESFVAHGAVQCGFCTPGMVLTAVDLLARHPKPGRAEIATAISGNLCRCTGYGKIVDAVKNVDASVPITAVIGKKVKPVAAPVRFGSGGDGRPVLMPESLTALWQTLAENPDVRVLAGGTDLLVWIRSRRVDPAALVSLERIEALRGISETADGVRIGACQTHATLLENPLIGRLFPVLTRALETLGSPHIRRMGTLGGNIMTASPSGDTLAPLHVLGASVELCSAREVRRMPIDAFILGPGKTALNPGEILSAVLIPKAERGMHQHFEKVGLRNAMACSVASLAAIMRVSGSGMIQTVALAWGSVGPTVMRAPKLEAALIGRPLTQETLAEMMPLASDALSPIDDIRASAAYRRRVAGNLLRRLVPTTPLRPDALPDTASGRFENE
jgi:xanthine dehydrogenase small subunit